MAVAKLELLPCCVWLMVLLVCCTALTLSPCVNDGKVRVAEVERGKNSSFYCRGFQAADTMSWVYLPDNGEEVFAVICPPLPASCQPGDVSPTFTASRRSANESVMTVDPSQGEDLVRQGRLTCGTSVSNDICRMDLITPAIVSTCSVEFERVNNDWLTTGRCDVTSTNSSRGRYTCRWYRTKGSSAEEVRDIVSYTPPSGVCPFTESLPTAAGVYSYMVKVTPGEVSKQASFTGSNEIKTPSAPTMTGCSADDYIAENTAVSCTCRTVNIGQPAGRLVWYRASVPVRYGEYGDDILTVSQTLTRADHDVTQFRCDVDWATDVQGESRTFKVGSPAVVSACSVKFEGVNNVWLTTGHCNITSANSSRGRYTCRWYRKKGSSAEEERNTVSYTPPNGVCNFTESMPTVDGEYSYRVKVTPGDVSNQASFTGSNEIKKPSAPTMTGCSADDYIAENTAVRCTCRTVNVGQPAGRLVWYKAGVPVRYGNYGDDTLTVSQTLTRADHDVTQFRCDVDWATEVQGESWTFKVGYKPERLSLKLGSGSHTEVTVKENNTVLLTCEADGRPVANMTLVRHGGSEIRVGQSPLTLTLTASSTDTGTYLCSASNVIGQADTSDSAKLYVESAQSDVTTGKSPPNYVPVGVGVALALVLVVIVVVVIWMWRRRWSLPWAQDGDQPRSKSISTRESRSMDLGLQPVGQASEPTDVSNPYDVLNTADIGQRSIYSDITHHTGQEHGNFYQNV